MLEPFLELALAVRYVEGWGWCGTAATEVGLIATTLAHAGENACVDDLRSASTAGRTKARGARRLRRRRTERDEWQPAGRSAYQIAGNGLEQLWEYLTTGRQRLDAPLDQRAGTEFQRRTWEILRRLPFGDSRAYGWVARQIGQPEATQAVGTAVGANQILIFIPCHRVVAARGVGGYSRGRAVKRRLLDHEKSWPRMEMLFADQQPG